MRSVKRHWPELYFIALLALILSTAGYLLRPGHSEITIPCPGGGGGGGNISGQGVEPQIAIFSDDTTVTSTLQLSWDVEPDSGFLGLELVSSDGYPSYIVPSSSGALSILIVNTDALVDMGQLVLPLLTEGSVPFIGSGGVVSEDANLTYTAAIGLLASVSAADESSGILGFTTSDTNSAGVKGVASVSNATCVGVSGSGEGFAVGVRGSSENGIALESSSSLWQNFSAVDWAKGGVLTTVAGFIGLSSVTDAQQTVVPIAVNVGTVMDKIRIKYAGSDADTGFLITVRKRDESSTTTSYTTIGAQQTMHSAVAVVTEYNLGGTPETIVAGFSYDILLESDVPAAQTATFYAYGVSTLSRAY